MTERRGAQPRQRDVIAASGGALEPSGPVAEAIADLWWLMLVVGAIVFALFLALLVRGSLRRTPDPTPEDQRALVRRWIVLGGVAMPTVVIVGVFAATLATMPEGMPWTVEADALEVEVTGHQFWYEVRYPEAGLVTANELHIPTGRPVALRLTSTDVIHSFWVPELGGKLDMLPERINTLVLEADEPGEFKSRCAEFCGLSHANMVLVVVAEPQDAFDDWVSGQLEQVATSEGLAADGKDLFVTADCVSCHALRGDDASGREGPDLTTLPGRRTLGAGLLANTRENVAEWIRDPVALKPGVEMPPTELTDAQLEALLAYLGYGR